MLPLLARAGRLARPLAAFGLDWLLPPSCPGCGAPVQGEARLCAACFTRLTFITAPFCRRCGLPLQTGHALAAGNLCPGCRAHPPVFARARAALLYDEGSRHLILALKHGDRTELASLLATLMARAGAGLLKETELILPVPLHRHRLRSRRFNQSALLAAQLARKSNRPWLPDGLIRLRSTKPLGKLSAAERRRSVSDAFAVKPGARAQLTGRSVLLIDDVLTSGATASACALTLLAAGVARVDVLVAARVPDPRAA
jgi:ComF family protein